MLLVSIKLGFDVVAEVVLIIIGKAGDSTSVLSIAASDLGRSGKSAIITSTLAETIEPFCTVGLCASPFTDNRPFVSRSELGTQLTGVGDVVGRTSANFRRRENLVLMCIEDHILVTGRGSELTVPVLLKVLEGIVNRDGKIGACRSDGLVPGLVEILEIIEIKRAAKRFIEELDG